MSHLEHEQWRVNQALRRLQAFEGERRLDGCQTDGGWWRLTWSGVDSTAKARRGVLIQTRDWSRYVEAVQRAREVRV